MASAGTSTGGAAGGASPATPRFDFYQTDTVVTVSIFVKAALEETLQVSITERTLYVQASSSSTGSEYVLRIDPLFSTVDPTSSSYKVLSTKIDVILHKGEPGVRWVSLHSGSTHDSVVSAATPSYVASQNQSQSVKPTAAAAAPRARSKWDSFNPEAEPDTEGAHADAAESEADINKFFQKLYADADDDTRRAMMKSYQESGGTTLSTDWSKVGKQPVKTQPPEGMEAKQW